MEGEKKAVDRERERVEGEKKIADLERNRAEAALIEIEIQKKRTEVALLKTDSALNEVKKQQEKNEKIIGAFYFYLAKNML